MATGGSVEHGSSQAGKNERGANVATGSRGDHSSPDARGKLSTKMKAGGDGEKVYSHTSLKITSNFLQIVKHNRKNHIEH